VDDHVEIIQHHPRAVHRAVHRARTLSNFLAHLAGDFLHDGAQMRFTRAGRNHKKIRHRRYFAHVEDDDVFRLFVVRELAAKQSQFSGIHSCRGNLTTKRHGLHGLTRTGFGLAAGKDS